MIKEFYQNVTNYEGEKLAVVDIKYFIENGANVNILLTARETSGKTTSALQYIREAYMAKGEKAIYVFNTEDAFKVARNKMLAANKAIYPQDWADVFYTSAGLLDRKTNTVFCLFATINSYHKFKQGGRDPLIKLIVYDECNEGLAGLRANQSVALENIIMSANKTVTVLLFGNRVTMDIPLFADLGLATIDEELQLIHKIQFLGKLRYRHSYSLLIYAPDPTTHKRLADFKITLPPPRDASDWRPAFSHQLGLYGQSVANEEDADNTELVLPHPVQQERFRKVSIRPRYILFDRINAEVFIDKDKREFLIKSLRPTAELQGKGFTVSFSPHFIRAPRVFVGTRETCARWWQLFRHNRVYFSDVVIKNKFLQDVVIRYARTNE